MKLSEEEGKLMFYIPRLNKTPPKFIELLRIDSYISIR